MVVGRGPLVDGEEPEGGEGPYDGGGDGVGDPGGAEPEVAAAEAVGPGPPAAGERRGVEVGFGSFEA